MDNHNSKLFISDSNSEYLITSYLRLRQFNGWIGFLLPVILIIYTLVSPTKMQISISHYYFSTISPVFTGLLFMLGGFLITYRCQRFSEKISTFFAGICAWMVASLPTNEMDYAGINNFIHLVFSHACIRNLVGKVHFGFAALLLLTLAYISYNEFTKLDVLTLKNDVKKEKRNAIYRWCAYLIVIFLVGAGLSFNLHWSDYSTFIFETTSLFAFGFSWLVKGSQLWLVSSNSFVRGMARRVR